MWSSIEQAITGFLRVNNNPLGLALLGLAATLEYVFPPFPGDTVTLFGAFLVSQYQWSLVQVFFATLAGSAAGALIDYAVGARMRRPYEQGRFLKKPRTRRLVERVLASFRRHGAAYVALNRFLPAVRAVFFLAAGMAGLKLHLVLIFALISAAAWNALVLGVGYALGANWERIQRVFSLYSRVAWAAIGLVALVLTLRWWVRRRAEADADGGSPSDEDPSA